MFGFGLFEQRFMCRKDITEPKKRQEIKEKEKSRNRFGIFSLNTLERSEQYTLVNRATRSCQNIANSICWARNEKEDIKIGEKRNNDRKHQNLWATDRNKLSKLSIFWRVKKGKEKL